MLKEIAHALLTKCISFLPRDKMAALLACSARHYARRLPPVEALQFLFEIDSSLYSVQGEMAIAYDGGLHTKHRHMKYHDFFVRRVAVDERVLDIGCGCGAVAFDLASRAGAEVVAIDMDPAKMELACRHYSHPRVEYMAGDVFKDMVVGYFDTIILSNVLEHIDARVEFLEKSNRIFKPKKFLIRVPLFERDWRVPLRKEVGAEWRLDPTHQTEYTLESFNEEMTAAGLRICHLEVRWGEIWCELRPLHLT